MNARSFDRSKYCTIPEACARTGYAQPYFRMHLVIPGKIEGCVKELIPGTTIPRWLVSIAGLEKYQSTHSDAVVKGKHVRNNAHLSEDEQAMLAKYRANKVVKESVK